MKSKSLKVYSALTENFKYIYETYCTSTMPLDMRPVPLMMEQFSDGVYYQKGWKEQMQAKARMAREAADKNRGEVFMFTDVDIQFFGNCRKSLMAHLSDNDLVLQCEDGNPANKWGCPGVMLMRGSEKLSKFWDDVAEYPYFHDDQKTVNLLLAQSDLKYAFFPRDLVWSIGFSNNNMVWTTGNRIPSNIPYESMAIHHANWTVGLVDKYNLMDAIRANYDNLKT